MGLVADLEDIILVDQGEAAVGGLKRQVCSCQGVRQGKEGGRGGGGRAS